MPYENEAVERDYPINYGGDTAAQRETEISREYGRLMKAIKELGMTSENLDIAFAPVLRSRLEPTVALGQESAEEPSNSTEHGIALQQARNSIEGITRQIRSVLERKEI